MPGGERQSFEFTILAILEYLVHQEPAGAVTKYHLMNRIPGLPSQRQDRVSAILDLLVQRGWITAQSNENTVVYIITPAGKLEYDKWAKQFLAWVRTLKTRVDES